jgi:hypothetical protein
MEYLRRKNEKTAEFFAGKTPVLRAEKQGYVRFLGS